MLLRIILYLLYPKIFITPKDIVFLEQNILICVVMIYINNCILHELKKRFL